MMHGNVFVTINVYLLVEVSLMVVRPDSVENNIVLAVSIPCWLWLLLCNMVMGIYCIHPRC